MNLIGPERLLNLSCGSDQSTDSSILFHLFRLLQILFYTVHVAIGSLTKLQSYGNLNGIEIFDMRSSLIKLF